MFNVSIPELSDEELMSRYSKIRPVITKYGRLHYFRKFTLDEVRKNNYLWNPDSDLEWWVEDDELKILEGEDFPCLHRYSHYALFKPTIAEVLSQIDIDLIRQVSAFEIIDGPKVSNDFYKDKFTSVAFKNGYHVSVVRLYESN